MIHIFMVNPFAGKKTFADDLRHKLERIENLNYFVFNIRYAGHEKDLVKRILNIFQNEKLRFYCCGGSGTMRNMLDGIEDLEHTEVAFFPCGLSNDFLKVFGNDEKRFHQIEELIYGDVISVDYIRTNNGVALNTFSVGLDVDLLDKLEEYHLASAFGEQMPYVLALLHSLFVSNNLDYEVYLDDQKIEGKFMEVFLGNGYVIGGNMYMAEKACVTDGKGAFLVAPDYRGMNRLPIAIATVKNDNKRVKVLANCGFCKSLRIRRKDGMPLTMNLDGELVCGIGEWRAEIVKRGLQLVVPKGVSL